MGWDRGLDFDTVLERIQTLRAYARELKHPRMLRPLDIAYIQLTNGLRISEAAECLQEFLESGNREIVVRVRKHKDKYRLCIVPPDIDRVDTTLLKPLPTPSISSVRAMIRYYLGCNTHSLRYAFINKLLKQGVDPATVSKIVGHKRLDTLMSYIQEKRAREVLLGLVRTSTRKKAKSGEGGAPENNKANT